MSLSFPFSFWATAGEPGVSVADFTTLTDGTYSSITGPLGWKSAGTFLPIDIVNCSDSFDGYTDGTITSVDLGTYWVGDGTFLSIDISLSQDNFDSYADGTIVSVDGGSNWGADGTFNDFPIPAADIVWLKLNEGSGTDFYDSKVGGGGDGTFTDSSLWSPGFTGKANSAVAGDGSSRRGITTASLSLSGKSVITVGIRFKCASMSSVQMLLEIATTTVDTDTGMAIYVNGAGSLGLIMSRWNGSSLDAQRYVTLTASPSLDAWHSLVLVCNRSADTLVAYVDGVVASTSAYSGFGSMAGSTFTDHPLRLLCRGTSTYPALSDTSIDDIRIWDGNQGIFASEYHADPDVSLPYTFSTVSPGPIALYDASLGVEVSSGVAAVDSDPVLYWRDQSGNGYDLTQATSGNRPLFKTAQLNNLPALRWDGSNDWLFASAFPTINLQNVTVIAVMKFNSSTNNMRALVIGASGAGTDSSSNSKVIVQSSASPNNMAGSGSTMNATITGTRPMAWAVSSLRIVAGVGHTRRHDIAGVRAASTTFTNSDTGLLVGVSYTSGAINASASQFSGDIALLAVFDRALTDEELYSAVKDLGATFDLTG